MPRPRERVYTLDKQKKHLARLSLLSAKRFRFNVRSLGRRGSDVPSRPWLDVSVHLFLLVPGLRELLWDLPFVLD